MNLLILIGIVIIVVGFSLKLDVLAVVLTAGIATGLAAKMSLLDILEIIGKAFVDNRLMSIFLISLPVIAVLERYGLRERSATLIGNLKNATAGKILGLYMIIRSIASALSIRIGGHIQFIRPLIHPMSRGAAVAKYGELSEEVEDDIKGLCAGVENFGNFFGQNCFLGASGTLLIVSTLTEQGVNVMKDGNPVPVDVLGIAMWSIPIAIVSVILGIIYFVIYDRKLEKALGGK